jgi:hypothetical protein
MNAFDRMVNKAARDMELGRPLNNADPEAISLPSRPPTEADDVQMGFTRVLCAVNPGTVTLTATPRCDFYPTALCAGSRNAHHLSLVSVMVGAINLIEGSPVPLETFSEVSTRGNRIEWPKVAANSPVTIVVQNDDTVTHTPRLSLRGWRAR